MDMLLAQQLILPLPDGCHAGSCRVHVCHFPGVASMTAVSSSFESRLGVLTTAVCDFIYSFLNNNILLLLIQLSPLYLN